MHRFPVTSKIFVNKDTEQALFVGYRSYMAMAVGLDQMAGQHVFYVVNQENSDMNAIGSLMGTGKEFREAFGLIRSQQTRGVPTQDEIERLYFELWIDAHLGVDHQCWKGLLDRMQTSFNLDMSKIAKCHIEEQAFSGMPHVEPEGTIISRDKFISMAKALKDGEEFTSDELDHVADEIEGDPMFEQPELTDEEIMTAVDAETGEVTYQQSDKK